MRKILIALGVVVALLGGAAVVVPRILFGDGVDYSTVASIQNTTEYQDPRLLASAWTLPVARLYRTRLEFQGNGSFCGPTSLVNVMRSLGVGATQDTVLEGTGVRTFWGILPGGVTLDQLAEIARKRLGRSVTVMRDLDLDSFRAELRRANDPARRYVINFNRGPLFTKAMGHHSPIAGYLAEQDLVLVLDVNEKYGPWLVRTDRLFTAMNTLDKASGKKRGLLLIQ